MYLLSHLKVSLQLPGMAATCRARSCCPESVGVCLECSFVPTARTADTALWLFHITHTECMCQCMCTISDVNLNAWVTLGRAQAKCTARMHLPLLLCQTAGFPAIPTGRDVAHI